MLCCRSLLLVLPLSFVYINKILFLRKQNVRLSPVCKETETHLQKQPKMAEENKWDFLCKPDLLPEFSAILHDADRKIQQNLTTT